MKRLGLSFLCLLACSEVRVTLTDANPGSDDGGAPASLDPRASNQLLGEPIRELDLLFVVDNSFSMEAKQRDLAFNLDMLLDTLERDVPLPLNLHIGLVSSDFGAGPFGIVGCNSPGDDGTLQNVPSGGGCSAPTDRYIVRNGTTTNFPGTIEETFSCIAQIGINGCGFEQPLESMRRALDGTNSLNAGFLRPDAMLAVVLLTDEDDCSAQNDDVFDIDKNLVPTLGPLSSYRCFEFGVVCDPDTPRAPGDRSDCKSRENSQYMYPMAEYADFLRGLKSLGGRVFFSAIAGEGDVSIENFEGDRRLSQTCDDTNDTKAVPAIRIADLSQRLGMPPVKDICNTVGAAMADIGSQVNLMMGGKCLTRPPGAGCRILDVENFGQAEARVVQELPSCDTSTTEACFRFTPNMTSCGAGGIEVSIDRRGNSIPANSSAVASCGGP